jgi:hypothetical protein
MDKYLEWIREMGFSTVTADNVRPPTKTEPPREEIVPLQRMVRELAETWERRATEWDALKQLCPEITSMSAIYREMAEDLRAVCGKLPNDGTQRPPVEGLSDSGTASPGGSLE